MSLHQLQLTYHAEEDRAMLRVSFLAEAEALHEVRLWLTRRLAKNLWATLLKTMEAQLTMNKPEAIQAHAELINMAHQESVSEIAARGDFNRPFDSHAQTYPMGETPLLVVNAQFKVTPGQPGMRINFIAPNGYNLEIGLSETMLHGFCALLQKIAHSAEWELTLRLPEETHVLPATRTLN